MSILHLLANSFNFAAIRSIPEPAFWLLVGAYGLFVLIFLFQAYLNVMRIRATESLATAKIRSAAQGYNQIWGVINYYQNPIYATLSENPCVWFRYTVDIKRNNRWVLIAQGSDASLFTLKDETAVCTVNPQGAQVITEVDCWYGFSANARGKPKNTIWRFITNFGNYRYQEWRLVEGMPARIMGNFITIREDQVAPTHWLSGENTTPDRPFLITSVDPKKTLMRYRINAFFWFSVYLILLGFLAFIIVYRLQ